MKKKKTKKHEDNEIKKRIRKQKQFDKSLRDCMRCKYFYGHSSLCAKSNCMKNQKQGMQKTVPEKCIDCNYGNGIYCFPCMNDILSKRGD